MKLIQVLPLIYYQYKCQSKQQLNTYFESISDSNNHDDLMMTCFHPVILFLPVIWMLVVLILIHSGSIADQMNRHLLLLLIRHQFFTTFDNADGMLIQLPTLPFATTAIGFTVYVHLPSSTPILILILVLVLILILIQILHIAIPTKLSTDNFTSAIIYNDSSINSTGQMITIDDSCSYNDSVSTFDLNVGGTNEVASAALASQLTCSSTDPFNSNSSFFSSLLHSKSNINFYIYHTSLTWEGSVSLCR